MTPSMINYVDITDSPLFLVFLPIATGLAAPSTSNAGLNHVALFGQC